MLHYLMMALVTGLCAGAIGGTILGTIQAIRHPVVIMTGNALRSSFAKMGARMGVGLGASLGVFYAGLSLGVSLLFKQNVHGIVAAVLMLSAGLIAWFLAYRVERRHGEDFTGFIGASSGGAAFGALGGVASQHLSESPFWIQFATSLIILATILIFSVRAIIEGVQISKSVRTQLGDTKPVRTLADIENIQFQEDLDVFFNYYYLHPRPEQVAEAIGALGISNMLEKDTAIPPMVGFFSEIFSANSSRLPQWQALIEQQPPATKSMLRQALAIYNKGGVLKCSGHHPELNDMYWGAFCASGQINYPRKLIEQLSYLDERGSLLLFITARTAQWSLATMAKDHKIARTMLETEKPLQGTRITQAIEELLTTPPEELLQKMKDIIRKKQDDGEWL